MPGPWERFQPQPAGGDGPWKKFQAPLPAAEQPQVAQPDQTQPSLGDQFMRGQGLGARNVIEGAGSVLTVPSDMLAGLLDTALEKAGVKFRFGSSSAALHDLLTKAGLPEAQTEGEQTAAKFGRAISAVPATLATGGIMAGAASPVVAGVGETLAANPVLQTTSAVTGTAGSEIARKAGYGPVGQAVGGLVGAAAPGVISAGAQALTRGAFRGGEQGRQTVEDNLNTFAKAGTAPTVGQATEGRVARAVESGLSRTPGSAGRMAATASDQADEVAANLEQQAQQLVGRSTSAEQTGRAIEQGVRGEGGFIDRFRQTQTKLYDTLDNFIAPDKPVQATATQAALGKLTTPIAGAAETSKTLINPTLGKLAEGLAADTASSGTVPYQALKELRTRVGQELENGLVSDVPAAQWKRIYGALSEDMKTAADTPEAMAAWRRADNYTRAGMQRIEAISSVVDRTGGPEAIFRAATSGTKEGASTLRSVMQSVDEDGQKMVTATVLRRLGLAKAGVQGDLGDKFSTETFLTNWNMLSPEAKRTLFNRYGDNFRSNMDSVAGFAANLREGSAVFRNPSGTAQASGVAAVAGTVAASVMSILTGNVSAGMTGLGAIGGLVGGANFTARLMTNPRFVKWLAQSTKIPAGTYTAQVTRLAQQARDTKDVDLARAAVALQQNEQPNDQANQPDRRGNQQ